MTVVTARFNQPLVYLWWLSPVSLNITESKWSSKAKEHVLTGQLLYSLTLLSSSFASTHSHTTSLFFLQSLDRLFLTRSHTSVFSENLLSGIIKVSWRSNVNRAVGKTIYGERDGEAEEREVMGVPLFFTNSSVRN
jgi:hypothetical protein